MAKTKKSHTSKKKKSQSKKPGIKKGTKLGPNSWTNYIKGACSGGYKSTKNKGKSDRVMPRSRKKVQG